jgi:hypothetical protein
VLWCNGASSFISCKNSDLSLVPLLFAVSQADGLGNLLLFLSFDLFLGKDYPAFTVIHMSEVYSLWSATPSVVIFLCVCVYSASHSRVAPEKVGLRKEQKCNTFVCHTCNEVRLCVLGIRKKEVGNTKR